MGRSPLRKRSLHEGFGSSTFLVAGILRKAALRSVALGLPVVGALVASPTQGLADGGDAHELFGGQGGADSIEGTGGAGGPGVVQGGGGGGGAGLQGGAGGQGDLGGAGGAGGTQADRDGEDGEDVATAGGGGGGGGGAHGWLDVGLPDTAAAGGNGGAGGSTISSGLDGGGGGAGGYGAVVTGTGDLGELDVDVSGGAGGAGGAAFLFPGDGGSGGIGLVLTSPDSHISISGTVAGGNGGAGGDSEISNGGDGGHGGVGVTGGSGTTFTVIEGATVQGGDGGPSGTGDIAGVAGQGGIGITGADLTVVNAGTIGGGMSGDSVDQADAVTFTSGTNTLEIHSTAAFIGNVRALGTNDTFVLGGLADGAFDLGNLGPAAQFQGFEQYAKTGTGTWTVSGTPGANGDWAIHEGRLVVGSGADLGDGLVEIFGGTLAGIGMAGPTTLYSGGTIAPGVDGIGTLTIDGDYAGDGGLLDIQAELGGDGSPADLLVIAGATSGETYVQVTNVGGTGAQTTAGVLIVQVDGSSNGDFILLGDYELNGEQTVAAGAYAYMLQQDAGDGDWYLRSATAGGAPLLVATVPLAEAYAGVLQVFNQPGTLQQRVGNRSWAGNAGAADGAEGSGLWVRIEGAHGRFEPETSTSGIDYDASVWKLQAGIDFLLAENAAGRLVGGLTGHYGAVSADIASPSGTGSIDSTGHGVGATLTWYAANGFYLDGQAQATWYDSDLWSDTLGSAIAEGNGGTGYALSIEAGKRIALGPDWSMTPQAQLSYSSVDFDDFTDGALGAAVSLEESETVAGRLGITADYRRSGKDAAGRASRTHVYGIANLYYDFDDDSAASFDGTALESGNSGLEGGLGVGGSFNWADDKYSLYGEALARTSLENFGDGHVLSGTVGFRVAW